MNRVYLACPVSTHETIRYQQNMARVHQMYPYYEIVGVRGLYQGGRHFMSTYQVHINRCSVLVFFTETDGTIGKGVHQEMIYAREIGLPVRWLDWMNAPFHIQVLNNGRDWRKYARIWPIQADEAAHVGHDGMRLCA